MLRRLAVFVLVGSVACGGIVQVVLAYSAGDGDQSFGDGVGHVTTAVGSGFETANKAAIQSDGKIVVVGQTDNSNDYDLAVIRYDRDGSLDESFSDDGKAILDVAGGGDKGYALAIQPDGRILAAGTVFNGSTFDLLIVRYNANGTLDETFDGDAGNGNGIVTLSRGATTIARSMTVLSNGKIVVAASNASSSVYDLMVIRYNADGTLDQTFDGDAGNGNGVVTTDVGGSDDQVEDLVVQADGRIVVAGYSHNGSNRDIAVVRYNADGTLDQTFDGDAGSGNGKITTTVGNGNDQAYGVTVQADGRIVVGGSYFNGVSLEIAVVRYNADGTLDQTFNGNGKATFAPTLAESQAHAVSLQADGRIIVVGYAGMSFERDVVVARFTATGSPDSSFSGDGAAIMDYAGSADVAMGAVLQNDGKLVVVGYARLSRTSQNHDFLAARFHLLNEPAAPASPPGSVAYTAANGAVNLRWAPVAGAQSYVVKSALGAVSCETVSTSCRIAGLRNGKEYTYRVHSVNADGVQSASATSVSARPGFQVKTTTLRTTRSLRLQSMVTSPSRGVKSWSVTSGGCRVQGDRLVAPTRRGTCRLRLAIGKAGPYPAMSTTITVLVTR